MGEEKGAGGRYKAFLSYSHKDAAHAAWLHRRLESYRIPRRLAGSEGEHGAVPERLAPIFRDREELPAAGDLSEKVRVGLAASDHLIVLCSPNAAASPWVAKEIAAFRELHPGRPVLAAIVAGEPPACFPAVLCEGGAEPLAADLREEGDGRRLGFLKLVAGLAGVGLDALVQRDAARRVRRVTWVTAAAVAAMLVMAVMTGIALNARAEAQRQRAEAEGLVEFMLTDLRNRLRSVGRLEIMEAVNARALQRYRTDPDAGAGEALSRRARILHAIGEDQIGLGKVASADQVFRFARTLTERELAKDPDNLDRQLDHARSEYWVGRIHELGGNWRKAERQYRRFFFMTDSLLRAAPDTAAFMRERGWSYINLGNVSLMGKNDPAAAAMYYRQAIYWFRRASRAAPHDKDAPRVLANAHGWLADSYFAQSMWEESLAARQRQYEIMRQMHLHDPKDADLLYRYGLAQRGLGYSLLKVGNATGAATMLDEADDAARRLAASDARNGDWLMFKAMLACDLMFSGVALPAEKTKLRLAREVRETSARLVDQRNPRARELSKCVSAASVHG